MVVPHESMTNTPQDADTSARYLALLTMIDEIISVHLDLEDTMQVALEQVISILGIDGGDILLWSSHEQEFNLLAIRNIHQGNGQIDKASFKDDLPQSVVNQKRVVCLDDLAGDSAIKPSQRLSDENGQLFKSYLGIPLVLKDECLGVLELFWRAECRLTSQEKDRLQSIVQRIAMAVGYQQLLDQKERDRQESLSVYEDTIQCWARTLEIRNYETEGHAQRVLELVIKIAKIMGIPQSSFAHIRYGVLLHDLGQLGIPETILHKSGPLSEEEWNLMRQHPVFSYELLSSVPYLQPSLDIPYCHHEKWDGSGYPRGLKGEEIPVTARIFAVVDVWDVLRSPRSYRPPWSVKDAQAYIKEQAGTYFDPEIVDIFLEMVDSIENN